MLRCLLSLFMIGVIGAAAADSAEPAPPPPIQVRAAADALADDAGQYAAAFGVPLDEAKRRLTAQEASVAATDRIAERYRDRLAGIAIVHRPDWHIEVLLTGAKPVPDEHISAGGMTVPIRYRTGALATRDQVVWAITYHQAEIGALLPSLPAMGLDPLTGTLAVVVGRKAAEAAGVDRLRQKIEAFAKVPVEIRVQDRTDVNLDLIGGGGRLVGPNPETGKRNLCTAGFVVTDGVRDGIVTAAHCLDKIDYEDPAAGAVPLDYVSQWGWGYQDVQVHLSDRPLLPYFYADTAKTLVRPVEGQRSRASTRAGDYVCHRGERTGYHCALVQLVDFAPAGALCAGPCLPTWVAVAGPDCRGGDSGGPVFIGTTALGLVKGASYRPDGSCAFYFYMSTDYLPPGWTLRRAGRSSPLRP